MRAGSELHARASQSLLTAQEVANLLGVPTSWVYEQSRLKRIPTVTLGRYRRYRLQAIENWIEELEVGETDGTKARTSNGLRGRAR